MKLILDNIIFFMQRSGGGSVYWAENIQRLDKKKIDIEYTEPKGQAQNIFYNQLRGRLKNPISKEHWKPNLLSFLPYTKKVKTNSKFIFHSSYYRLATSSRAINVVTVFDFMPEMFFSGLKRMYHSYRKKKSMLKADALVCISESTREDLLHYYPEVKNKPLTTIYLGVADHYFPLNGNKGEMIKALPEKYVLFVGRRAHYKNFLFAVNLLARLKDYHLVVVGEAFTKEEKESLSSLKNNYTLIKNPDNEKVNELYNGAFCLLYPSSYEGFGIPVIEAMKSGCPVVGLNASSIMEISNGAALLLDSLSIDDFSEAIISLENGVLRAKLIDYGFKNASRFSWDRATNELLSFYRSLDNSFGKNAN